MTVHVCTSSYIMHSKQIYHTDLDVTLYSNAVKVLFRSLQYIKCNEVVR